MEPAIADGIQPVLPKEPSMKIRLARLLLVALFAGASVHAADTGPVPAKSSATDRLKTARAAIQGKEWKKALAELNLAAREDPRNADVQNLLGYSYRKQGTPDLPKAFEHYQAALRLDPRHKGAHEYIGEAYLMDKKPAEAEKHLAALAQICGNTTCEEYEDLAKAIAEYKARH
jgi:Tfp pilus assembly protein PilF